MVSITKTLSKRPLSLADAVRLKSAQCWLALGIVEEAARELLRLRRSAALHPEAVKVFREIQCALGGSAK